MDGCSFIRKWRSHKHLDYEKPNPKLWKFIKVEEHNFSGTPFMKTDIFVGTSVTMVIIGFYYYYDFRILEKYVLIQNVQPGMGFQRL